MQQFMVQVPPGLGPGQMFHANIGGTLVGVQVPPGVFPGQQLAIQVSVQPQVQMMAPPPNPYGPPPTQQFRPPPAPMQRAQTRSMLDDAEAKRKMEEAMKKRQEEAAAAQREANSALAQMEARRAETVARAAPAAQQPPRQMYGRNPYGGASAKPGEVSALWWLGMGL